MEDNQYDDDGLSRFGEIGGFEKAWDVVAHEYTHAVIDYTAELFYNDFKAESSALHEAYADIMGSLIEGKGKASDARWEFGEDSDRVLRSIKDPTNSKYDAVGKLYLNHYSNYDRDPDYYLGSNYINSTIFSHAAYKMMTDSRTIGRSDTTWAKVFYNSLGRLNENSRFLDARMAVLSAAKELGFTSNQQQAIKEAFDAVGITEPATIRIVLRWGSMPRDLDSHLTGPSAVTGGSRFHTWYSRRNYYQDGTTSSTTAKLAADLDYDVVSGYGPEVTTIRKLTPGTYKFYVHNFGGVSGSTNLARSGATVEIYWGTIQYTDAILHRHFKPERT